MKSFNRICAFFIACIISSSNSSPSPETPGTPDSSSSSSSGYLGIAACHVHGALQTDCGIENIDVNMLPAGCTSFLSDFMNLTSLTVIEPEGIPDGFYKSLGTLKKPVVPAYFHSSWVGAVKNIQQDKACIEVEAWRDYLKEHPEITGLALSSIEIYEEADIDANYTCNLATYIEIMKKNFNLKMGLYINSALVSGFIGSPQLECIDLAVLDKCVDFYVVLPTVSDGVLSCTLEYKHGDTPINSYLKKTQKWIEGFNIPKEKVVYDIYLQTFNANLEFCGNMYPLMCTNENGSDVYCADTLQNFYDKGVYLKQNAGGFGVRYIDQDDANCVCGCSRSFPTFNAILDGFNGNPPPESCCLIDRPN